MPASRTATLPTGETIDLYWSTTLASHVTIPARDDVELCDCPDCEGRGEIGHWQRQDEPSDETYIGATRCGRCDGEGVIPETSV